ncbi:60S ribosomal protein L7-1 [Hibiscus syriacus]|uniref:60S ribosomal protein L7-1 n=2 Tax=Hibiscus syriacus TaxID=106335 RepID=A0A6A3BCL4_HIBSY|nr:60S ribosomal protein L7-1 [Hibiscus syriacus]
MKQRANRPKSMISKPKSNLLFIIRIQGKNDMHPKTRKILYKLRLRKVFSGVFVKETEGVIDMLQKVEPYVTFGYPNLRSVKELVYKKGYAKIYKKAVPLTDNNIIEQTLGKYGIICIEDIIHKIANVGPHFKEVVHFMGPFMLSKPEDGLIHGKKQSYKEGGDAGNRENEINDLINKMN